MVAAMITGDDTQTERAVRYGACRVIEVWQPQSHQLVWWYGWLVVVGRLPLGGRKEVCWMLSDMTAMALNEVRLVLPQQCLPQPGT
jgi:hypothetical protein